MRKVFQFPKYLILLATLASLIRIIIFFLFEAIITPDTSGYISFAEYMKANDFSDFDGGRTPGYPLIIFLANLNIGNVVIIQLIMGICISVMLFLIIAMLSKNPLIAFFVGLSHSLYIPFLHRELIIATEVTAMFFIIISIFCIVKYLNNDRIYNGYFLLFITNIAASMAALTRPVYQYFPYLIMLFISIYLILNKIAFRKLLLSIFILYLPVLLIISGWKLFNYKVTGYYVYTTFSGISLSNKVAGNMEIASDEFKDIRDIYVKYRNEQLKRKEDIRCCVIWRAFAEMQEKTGLSTPELANRIKLMSLDVIKKDPIRYLKTIIPSLYRFWKPVGIGEDASFILRFISIGQRLIFILLEFLFLILPVFYLLQKKFRVKINLGWNQILFYGFLYAMVICNSIIVALFEQGEPRYSFPTDPIIIIVVVCLLFFIIKKYSYNPQESSVNEIN